MQRYNGEPGTLVRFHSKTILAFDQTYTWIPDELMRQRMTDVGGSKEAGDEAVAEGKKDGGHYESMGMWEVVFDNFPQTSEERVFLSPWHIMLTEASSKQETDMIKATGQNHVRSKKS